ncbi:DUF262 domain-containing protein [Neobacillus cucumis]|nr:DUF262 domain-containing protein [Neobacillus cucumis]
MNSVLKTLTIYELWKLYQDDHIVTNSSYQRRDVWLQKDKIKLIETLLIDSIVPEIYLWDKQEGHTRYEIIDGQQRLKSIFDFISESPFKLDAKWLEFPEEDYSNLTFEQLADNYKSKIFNYPLVTRLISDVGLEDIKRLFLRLNSTSFSLNPQELRNADFNGHFLILSEKIANQPFWFKYNTFSKNDIRRMKDIEFCSSLLIFLKLGFQTENQALINEIYDRYNDVYPEQDADFEMIITLMSIVDKFLESNNTFAKNKVHLFTLFTIAYWFVDNKREISESTLNNYNSFCKLYSLSEDELEGENLSEEYLSTLLDYKSASIEGTNSKLKRFRRFEKLRTILSGEIS